MKRRGCPRPDGFALVPALFLMIVLGLLAVVGVRLGVSQQQAVTLSLLEARTLAAAKAGIEWGAYQATVNGSCSPATTLALTEAALSGYTVVVACTATAYSAGSGPNPSHSWSILATATLGTYGQPGYVRRVMSGTFTDAT